jgi:RNA polymerase sigma-54 factor
MNQGQIQEQRQEQRLTQTLSQQQLLVTQLLELPITQLQDRVNTEMNDNPALETSAEFPDDPDFPESAEYGDAPETTDDFDTLRDREDRQSALDEALQSIGRDDEELPVYQGGSNLGDEREEMVYGETLSFYDQLKEQMQLLLLTDRERDIMEYLIGSLDNDGLLRKPLDNISDELAVYHNIDATTAEIEQVLKKLQQTDPAGIGARTLQECLLLQIQRREDSRVKTLMQTVIADYFDAFTKKHWQRIKAALRLSDLQAETLFGELRRLNPKPGAAMGEAVGRSMQQITPDFIIDTHDDGSITFTLNQSELPELQVSQSFADSMKEYQKAGDHLTRQTKEALLYIKKKVDAAQSFIEALRMRRHTLTVTMQAIIQLQRQFFLDGDEASLRPMILKDVAERTGLDISTISRVSNSKYAQTRWGTFPLRHFFSDSYTTGQGEELSTRQIKAALRDMIENEDKNKPLSDDALTRLLAQRGYDIARRTVAKYREQLGIPVARLRK